MRVASNSHLNSYWHIVIIIPHQHATIIQANCVPQFASNSIFHLSGIQDFCYKYLKPCGWASQAKHQTPLSSFFSCEKEEWRHWRPRDLLGLRRRAESLPGSERAPWSRRRRRSRHRRNPRSPASPRRRYPCRCTKENIIIYINSEREFPVISFSYRQGVANRAPKTDDGWQQQQQQQQCVLSSDFSVCVLSLYSGCCCCRRVSLWCEVVEVCFDVVLSHARK